MENNTLKHHGILGMRWGIRRSKKQLNKLAGRKSPEEETEEEREASKQRAINSGDTTEVGRYKNYMTNDEFNRAVNRIDTERRLSEAMDKEVKTGMDRISEITDAAGKIANAAETGVRLWNIVAKINNTFGGKELPTIDGTNIHKKRAEAKKEEKEKTDQKIRDAYIRSATPEDLAKGFGTFSKKEVEEITARLRFEQKIREELEKKSKTKSPTP